MNAKGRQKRLDEVLSIVRGAPKRTAWPIESRPFLAQSCRTPQRSLKLCGREVKKTFHAVQVSTAMIVKLPDNTVLLLCRRLSWPS